MQRSGSAGSAGRTGGGIWAFPRIGVVQKLCEESAVQGYDAVVACGDFPQSPRKLWLKHPRSIHRTRGQAGNDLNEPMRFDTGLIHLILDFAQKSVTLVNTAGIVVLRVREAIGVR